MPITTQVRVHDGTSWRVVSNASNIRLRRRVGASEASFRVENASITQRDLLRTGRECEVVITVDGARKVFGGFIDRPRIGAKAPGHFAIFPRVVDLTHGATWHTGFQFTWPAGTKYTQIIWDTWYGRWNEVDRSGIQDNSLIAPDVYRLGFETLGRFMEKIGKEYLPDWVWWVGHDGADANGIQKKLYVQPRGHNDRTGSVTVTEDDIGFDYQIQPTVDPRSDVLVVGDDDPEVDGNWPLYVTTFDAGSRSAYGTRLLVARESEAGSTSELNNIARSMLEQRKFDLWQGRFKIENWTLEPGDKVSMYLPTIGVNNGTSGVPWILMEVEEQVNRGVAQRWGTFVEHNYAAFIRVT